MPSDPLLLAAVRAMAAPVESYRSAVASAAEEVRALLGRGAPSRRVAATLGAFAAGRVDPDRFAGFVERSRPLDAPALAALTACGEALARIAEARPEDLVVVAVPEGGSLRDAVARTLSRLGRAFGAARAAALVRQGRWTATEGAALLADLSPRAWTRRERRLAPPLVVEVHGADLRAGDLAEFLDGGQKIVLVVRGPAAAAPLVPLVTPGTYVLQTGDAAGLSAMAASPGPGVAAVLPEGAAWFAHDPAGGPQLHARFKVGRLPPSEPRAPLGGRSAAQQADEVRQLVAMSTPPKAPAAAAVPAGSGAAVEPEDPAGRLAAWLLSSVSLDDVG